MNEINDICIGKDIIDPFYTQNEFVQITQNEDKPSDRPTDVYDVVSDVSDLSDRFSEFKQHIGQSYFCEEFFQSFMNIDDLETVFTMINELVQNGTLNRYKSENFVLNPLGECRKTIYYYEFNPDLEHEG